MVTILAVSKEMGRKTTLIYLLSIAFISILMGMLLNWVYLYLGVDVLATVGSTKELIPGIIKIAGSVILLGLMANAKR